MVMIVMSGLKWWKVLLIILIIIFVIREGERCYYGGPNSGGSNITEEKYVEYEGKYYKLRAYMH